MLKLSDYDISEETGFLPSSPRPLEKLHGEYFAEWEDAVSQMAQLIKDKRLREQVHSLPEREFSKETLKTKQEWRRAYLVLTFLSQAYIWMEGENALPDKIPQKLAVPWYKVSEYLGLQPSSTYCALVLDNYAQVENQSPSNFSLENLRARHTFTGKSDESWFYMIHTVVECLSAPGLRAIEGAFKHMRANQIQSLSQHLREVTQSIQAVRTVLNRMYDGCQPAFYYVNVRPFLAGSKGLSAFPNGIIYEGVDESPHQYHGASAGQSSSIHAFDIFLGAVHTGSDLKFLEAMRLYMPQEHREFLSALKHQPSVRDYARNSGDTDLIKSYNEAVDAFVQFRNDHTILVTRFIVSQKSHSVNSCLETRGTGGSPFMQFLKRVRDNTIALKIK